MTSTQITLLVIFIPIILLFAVFSVIMLMGKGSFLIAGYNTLSEIEKSQYKEKELTKFMGKIALIITISLILFVVGLYFELYWTIPIFVVSVFGSCIYAGTVGNSKRFKNY